MSSISERILGFERNGYVVLEGFLTPEECDSLRAKSQYLIENKLEIDTHPKTIFSTTDQKNDEYFMNSQDKIRFFFEESVFNGEGILNRPKHLAVNKIGHGLHYIDEDYKKATFHPEIQGFAEEFGFIDPRVVQSMVIFKQPGIGGEVVPHQDGSFLIASPSKLIGVWIALEDANVENGCLHFIPGSQTRSIRRKMIRNPDQGGPSTVFDAPAEQFDDKEFVAVPIKKGSAIVIHGQVVHKSERNLSSLSREIYTYHIAEFENSVWSAENWIQETDTYKFPKLYA